MLRRTRQRLVRSLLLLPCLLGILALSPLFANAHLQATSTYHASIAASGGRGIPQMPGPNK
jgi:hypothetical protein